MQERAVCSDISWKSHTQRKRNEEAAEGRSKNKLLKGWKPVKDIMRKLHSKLVWGGSTGGKIYSLSYMSLELKCFLHPVHSEETGGFAVEKECCAEVHGEKVHTSHGMDSKQISSFHCWNSYNLINAVWYHRHVIPVSVAHLRHVPALTEHHQHLLKFPNISLGCCLHLHHLLPPSSLGTVRNESEPHKIHLSQTPSGKVMSSSAILLLHATAAVCCTWLLYRPQMGFLIFFHTFA